MADHDGGPDTGGGLAPPEERGTLSLADRVVEKIASAAAREMNEVTQHSSGWIPGRSLPRASTEIAGEHARIGVEIASPWPTPLADIAARTRDHVQERVSTLTGIDVVAVDVTVAEIVHLRPNTRRAR